MRFARRLVRVSASYAKFTILVMLGATVLFALISLVHKFI
jgi:hypothetical protein